MTNCILHALIESAVRQTLKIVNRAAAAFAADGGERESALPLKLCVLGKVHDVHRLVGEHRTKHRSLKRALGLLTHVSVSVL